MLDDIVILHVVNGSDFFCMFNGKLEQGIVLETRQSSVRIDNPIRKIITDSKSLKTQEKSKDYDSDDEDGGF